MNNSSAIPPDAVQLDMFIQEVQESYVSLHFLNVTFFKGHRKHIGTWRLTLFLPVSVRSLQVHYLPLALLKLLLAVIVYSTALSFSDEVELMWMKKPSIPSVLYFLARYPAILFFSSAVVGDFLPQEAVCGF